MRLIGLLYTLAMLPFRLLKLAALGIVLGTVWLLAYGPPPPFEKLPVSFSIQLSTPVTDPALPGWLPG